MCVVGKDAWYRWRPPVVDAESETNTKTFVAIGD